MAGVSLITVFPYMYNLVLNWPTFVIFNSFLLNWLLHSNRLNRYLIVDIFSSSTVEMSSSGFGGIGGGVPMNSPINHSYQAMMTNIQKLLALNPDFLTKGIPDNLLQMCMEQTKFPQMGYGVSETNRNYFHFIHLLIMIIFFLLSFFSFLMK